MSKLFGKLQSGGNRLFRKIESGGNKLLGKMKSQVFDNPRLLHTVSNGLSQAGNYGDKGLKIGAGLAFG